ncbi:MAG: hypothetical protein JOY91_01310 [Sinobacteraceae bacterium]|nr:hypothetical protein [Nevskiaceae bacterium]
MPEELAETFIDYATGEQLTAGCAGDATPIAVPVGTQLPVKPGCGTRANDNGLDAVVKRAGEWLRDIIH